MYLHSRTSAALGVLAILSLAGCDKQSANRSGPEADALRLQAAGFLGVAPDRIVLSDNDGQASAVYRDGQRQMTVEFGRDGTVRKFVVLLTSGKDSAGQPGSFYGGQRLSVTVVRSIEDLLVGRVAQAETRLTGLDNDVQAAATTLTPAQLRTANELAGSVKSAMAANDVTGAAMALLPLYRLIEEARPRIPNGAPLDLALLRYDVLNCRLLAQTISAIQSGNDSSASRAEELWSGLAAANSEASARASRIAQLLPGAAGTNLTSSASRLAASVDARDPASIAKNAAMLDSVVATLEGLFARKAIAL